jgi:hypothetical protein
MYSVTPDFKEGYMMQKNKAHTLNTKIFFPSVMCVGLLKYINWEAYNNYVAKQQSIYYLKGLIYFDVPYVQGFTYLYSNYTLIMSLPVNSLAL